MTRLAALAVVLLLPVQAARAVAPPSAEDRARALKTLRGLVHADDVEDMGFLSSSEVKHATIDESFNTWRLSPSALRELGLPTAADAVPPPQVLLKRTPMRRALVRTRSGEARCFVTFVEGLAGLKATAFGDAPLARAAGDVLNERNEVAGFSSPLPRSAACEVLSEDQSWFFVTVAGLDVEVFVSCTESGYDVFPLHAIGDWTSGSRTWESAIGALRELVTSLASSEQ